MAAGLNSVLTHLRKVAAAENAEQLSDRQLVERFVAERSDEAAFAALVHRHAAMVLNVCWRVLQNDSDADDARQATFMVLARKASSIRKKDSVASWLHGVAYRAASNMRKENVRRLARERQAAASRSRPKSEVTWREVQTILDEEIQRLPEELKGPVLLCYLEGKAHNEGAQQLGWSLTTFRGRLERGREVLRKRLTQRGVALSGALLAAVLSEKAASAAVSGSSLSVLVKGALATETTKGVVSAHALSLAHGVMQATFWNKLKIAVVGVLLMVITVGVSGLALHGLAGGGQAQDDKPPTPGKPVAASLKPADRPVQGKQGPADKPVVVQEDAQVRTLAWSSNGKIVATIGIVYEFVEFKDGDGKLTENGGVIPHSTIKLWDATTGELKRSLGEEKDTFINAIAFSADGKTAAISTSKHVLTNQPTTPIRFETEVRVMDAQTWALKHTVKADQPKTPIRFEDGFASVLAFSPDGTSLALGGSSGAKAFVRLWDVQKQKMMGGTEGGGARVHCLAFSIDGKQLVTGDENGKVRLFDGRTGAGVRDFEGHGPLRSGGEQCVTGVGFSPDGKTLVSGSQDKTLKLWDVETGKLLRNLEGNKARVSALAFSPDGKLFATAGSTADSRGPFEVLLWDMNTGQPKETFPEQTVPVNSLAFSPDGSTLAIGGGAGFNSKVNAETGRAKTPGEFKLWKLKQEKEKEMEAFTAWGKEAGDLQAGLGFRPSERRAYHHGETVTLIVRVRNVGKETVKFQYIRQFLDENPPTVTDADGKTAPQARIMVTGESHVPVEVSLAPGKENRA
jgi:RNA polymerase sigma factor (sigma-70 family)